MNLWNLKIKEFLSFEPHERISSNYNLITLDADLINKFISDIGLIENNPNFLLCLRGDSKNSVKSHITFFNKGLSNLFIVGNKAKSYYKIDKQDDFEYYQGKNLNELLSELCELVNTCNYEISQKPQQHRISGKINKSFIDNLKFKSQSELEHWRLFFISFLHNNGIGKKYEKFKDYSPFVSLTYGNKKASISRRFAIDRTKHKKGYVFIIVVDTSKRDYIKTHDLITELSNFGIKWYGDKHKECMLLNGAFPHYILGLFEVQKTRTPRLIVNPWLYKEYKENRAFNTEIGIPVNQEFFHEWMNYDNCKRYFYEDYNGNQYISEINQFNKIKKIDKFK